jgi:four helix bundle protein
MPRNHQITRHRHLLWRLEGSICLILQQLVESVPEDFPKNARAPRHGAGGAYVKYFEDLDVWKEARRLTNEIYAATRDGAFSKDFGLRDQIQRAAVSIMSNIAEGFERGGNQEFLQFLYIAKGSCGEVRSQLYVALDQGYVTKEQFVPMFNSLRKQSGMLAGLIEYLRRSRMRGEEYKKPAYKSLREELEDLTKQKP